MNTVEQDSDLSRPVPNVHAECRDSERSFEAKPGTLAQAIAPHSVSFDRLELRYQPMHRLLVFHYQSAAWPIFATRLPTPSQTLTARQQNQDPQAEP